VENVYIAYNSSNFAIYVPKIIEIHGNLRKLWQKQKCTVFRHGVVTYSSILCHFRVIWRWILSWPWNPG